MSLKVRALRDQEEAEMAEWLSDRRLWFTGHPDDPRTRVVEEGDPDAAFLMCGVGQVVPAGYVHRFNLPTSLQQKQAEPVEDKQSEPGENKAVRRGPGRPRKAE